MAQKLEEKRSHHLDDSEALSAAVKLLEKEKTRIAKDLHDQMGQTISLLLFDARWLAKQESLDLTQTRIRAERIVSGLNEIFTEVNKIINQLRPEMLDSMSMQQSISTLVSTFANTVEGCEFITEFNGDLEVIDKANKLVIFRMVQECLTNIARHSKAKAARVVISAEHDELKEGKEGLVKITITDDGKGFDVKAPTLRNGLSGIRARLTASGGALSIESTSAGTTIIGKVPFMETSGTAASAG